MLSWPAAICAAEPQLAPLPCNSVRWPVAAASAFNVTVTMPAEGTVLTMRMAGTGVTAGDCAELLPAPTPFVAVTVN